MKHKEKKYEIIEHLLGVEEEETLYQIQQILQRESLKRDIPKIHKDILKSRLEQYQKNQKEVVEWQEVKGNW